MARIPEDFIQQLLDRTDIVALIEKYVPLKKAGANYQARCPFHNEKSPSFTVSPVKQFYHCFGCGAHGTAISFLMQHTGAPFIDAVKELAAQAGMQVPDDGKRDPAEDNRRARLLECMEIAERHYRQCLKPAERAIAYLKERGVTGETAARFGLGFAPDGWQPLAEAVGDYKDELLVEAGLVISNEGKRYDRFRDRVMFPIRNERGQVIGFGGRVMGQGEPKYLNSPETPLFHKGRELYGLHEHRRAIQEADRVVVVEGYMDVVMLDQFGVTNAVATLGTAITADQAARLLRLADEVVFAFDGDNAGRKAAWRALENSLPQVPDGKRLAFLFLPEGEDPDSFVRAKGAEAFRQLCDRAMPLSDFLFSEMQAQTDLGSQEGKVRLAKLMEPYLARLTQAPLLARVMKQRLAALTGLEAPRPPAAAQARPWQGRPEGGRGERWDSNRPRPAPPQGRAKVLPSPWRVLLEAVCGDPAVAARLGALPDSPRPEAQALLTVISLLREHPEITARDLPGRYAEQPELAALIADAQARALERWIGETEMQPDLEGALQAVRSEAARAVTQSLGRRPVSDLSAEEKALLLASLRSGKPGG